MPKKFKTHQKILKMFVLYLCLLSIKSVFGGSRNEAGARGPYNRDSESAGTANSFNQNYNRIIHDEKQMGVSNDNHKELYELLEEPKPEVYVLDRNYTLFPETPAPEGFSSAYFMPISIALIVGACGLVISILATIFCVRPLIISHQQSDTLNLEQLELDDF